MKNNLSLKLRLMNGINHFRFGFVFAELQASEVTFASPFSKYSSWRHRCTFHGKNTIPEDAFTDLKITSVNAVLIRNPARIFLSRYVDSRHLVGLLLLYRVT